MNNLALVAHDNRKADLIEWVKWNYETLLKHKLICTGTTGGMVERALEKIISIKRLPAKIPKITKLKSGLLGGDQQLSAMVAEGKVDILIFLWDPMDPHPHDVDVKALLRIAFVYNVPIACNRSSVDFFVSSSLLNESYKPVVKNYYAYIERKIT
jgi:methylglyoxal synthase